MVKDNHSTKTLGKLFQLYLPKTHRTYSCVHCRAQLANHDELISKILFSSINVNTSAAEERVLLTGLHEVADIYCECCKTLLGWKYTQRLDARNPSDIPRRARAESLSSVSSVISHVQPMKSTTSKVSHRSARITTTGMIEVIKEMNKTQREMNRDNLPMMLKVVQNQQQSSAQLHLTAARALTLISTEVLLTANNASLPVPQIHSSNSNILRHTKSLHRMEKIHKKTAE
ncbi:unnamed protein product [Didymodactylos carnosus]|uniref:Yippee domain-containing protein n=1 Tax=Didymodactylos carnosus TaxID=1234261 RepID=A0A813V1Q5_9BILA|nr:unnamed protein product [Didymodactylos carnosus]CAF3618514.1 unnamed protein product [Didymodactylos carnosus]